MLPNPNIGTRCLCCRMHINLCLCDQMPHFDLKTRIVVFIQRAELKIVSGTAHYIPKIFKNAELRLRGGLDRVPMDMSGLFDQETQPLILYPSDDAKILDESFIASIKKTITLLVPDGSWRQSVRIVRRLDPDKKVPRVILPLGAPSNYRLRHGPRADGVCTFEAIARSIGIIEGEEIQKQLEKFFDEMVRRVMWTRGKE